MLDAAAMEDIPRVTSDSFDEVVRDRQAVVLRTAYRITGNWADAEDVAQEAFVRLHRHGLNFAGPSALGAWLYRVTVNLCLDRARTRTRRSNSVAAAPASSRDFEDLPAAADSAETELIRAQQKERLMAALALLPPKERAALVLREIEGLSTAEVAAALGSREPTVRSQVSKALVRLRELMARGER